MLSCWAVQTMLLQLSYLMLMTSIIPLLPWANVRRWFYNWSALTCFRILSRSISAVVTFHNRELRPKSDGICVANHTTPIDVFILSCDKTYAMVRVSIICQLGYCESCHCKSLLSLLRGESLQDIIILTNWLKRMVDVLHAFCYAQLRSRIYILLFWTYSLWVWNSRLENGHLFIYIFQFVSISSRFVTSNRRWTTPSDIYSWFWQFDKLSTNPKNIKLKLGT